MRKYQSHFELNPNDLDLIEQSLRIQVALDMREQNQNKNFSSTPQRVKEIQLLLGKIHNQKNFYACVHSVGVPVG